MLDFYWRKYNMRDMSQYCDNCPIKDTCSLEQKHFSILLDHYYTNDGRRIEIVKERIKTLASLSSDAQDWKQLSLFDADDVPD